MSTPLPCPTPCPTCPRKYRPLPGDGSLPSRFLAIGERPGKDENSAGLPFVGVSGQEQNETYLPLAGLRRSDIRFTNAVQCWADNNRTPSAKEVSACAAHHLPAHIAACRPEVIFLIGGSACRLCPGIVLDAQHGIPQHTRKVGGPSGSLFGWSGWVVPMWHPAAGLRVGKVMSQLLEDWASVGRLLQGGNGAFSPDPPTPTTNYRIWRRGARPQSCSTTYLPGVDTESHGARPYSIQVADSPGSAVLYPAGDPEALDAAARAIADREIVMHHAGHDVDECARMGVRIARYRDTMQEAYHLGTLPQGLKSLTYRLFRHTMTSWEDTVRPASINALLSWLSEAIVVARMDLYGTKTRTFKTCVCGHGEAAHWTASHASKCDCPGFVGRTETEEVAGDTERLFKRLIDHSSPAPDSEYDPWERLSAWRVESTSDYGHVVARCGEYPILGIGNCTEAQAVAYACGDADWTARAAVELARLREERAIHVAPGDEDR